MKTSKFDNTDFVKTDVNGNEYKNCRCGKKVYSDQEFNTHVDEAHGHVTLLDISY